MKYKNTKTGAIVDVNATLGGAWVSLDVQAPKKVEKVEPKTRKNKKEIEK